MKNRIFFVLYVLLGMNNAAFGAELKEQDKLSLAPLNNQLGKSRSFISFSENNDDFQEPEYKPDDAAIAARNRYFSQAEELRGKLLQFPTEKIKRVLFINDDHFKYTHNPHSIQIHDGNDKWLIGDALQALACNNEIVSIGYTLFHEKIDIELSQKLDKDQQPILEVPIPFIISQMHNLSKPVCSTGGYIKLFFEDDNSSPVYITHGSSAKKFVKNLRKITTPGISMLMRMTNPEVLEDLTVAIMRAVDEKNIDNVLDADSSQALMGYPDRVKYLSDTEKCNYLLLGHEGSKDKKLLSLFETISLVAKNTNLLKDVVGAHLGVENNGGFILDQWFFDSVEINTNAKIISGDEASRNFIGTTPELWGYNKDLIIICYRLLRIQYEGYQYGFVAIPTKLIPSFNGCDIKYEKYHGYLRLGNAYIRFGGCADIKRFIFDLTEAQKRSFNPPDNSPNNCWMNAFDNLIVKSFKLRREKSQIGPSGDRLFPARLIIGGGFLVDGQIEEIHEASDKSGQVNQVQNQSLISNNPASSKTVSCDQSNAGKSSQNKPQIAVGGGNQLLAKKTTEDENFSKHPQVVEIDENTPKPKSGILNYIKTVISQSSLKTKFVMGFACCALLYKISQYLLHHHRHVLKNCIV